MGFEGVKGGPEVAKLGTEGIRELLDESQSRNYGDQGRVKVGPKYAKDRPEGSKWDLSGSTEDLRGPGRRRVLRV